MSALKRSFEAFHGGGKISACYTEHSIRLAPKDSVVCTEDTFSTDFIINCVAADKLLNIEKYRLPISKKTEKELIVDVSKTSNIYSKKRRPNQQNFTYKEDEDMLIYIHKVAGVNRVKGNSLWKEMECRKVTSHPWQGMRNRLLRKIVYNLEQYSVSTSFKQALAEQLGVKYRPKSHQCPSSAKMTEQNAANVENRMEVEVGGSENNVRNNNRNGYKEVETDSITQKTVLSSPAKYSTYDEGSVKSACVGDLSCDINQDKDSNPNSKSSVSVAAESRVLRRRCRLTNKRVISSASNSEETDSSSSSSSTRETQSEAKILKTRASNVLYSKTINKGMETSQIRKKVGRTSNKETRVADNIKTKHEDDNVSACSPKDIPLKRHTRRLNPTKHTHLDLTERLPQPIHEHVIESKRQCFSSNENPKLLQNESLPQPSSLCHSPIVPSGDKCEALTVDSELNSCNEVHCFEANESQQQPKSFGNDEYIESILKPSSKSYNLRSKYGTPPSSSVPDAPLQDQGTSKPQEKCHSPFKYEQQSKDTDDDNSKDSLVSSYISFEEFCEAKNSFQKMSIIEFMDGLEELSESSEEFEGLHDRKTLESRPTNTKKSLPWFRSVANHRMPSSYVRCKDVALQTDMKSNLLVHQTNVAVQTDHNPGCCLPSCSLEREVQSNTNDNLEILTTPTQESTWISNSLSGHKPEYVKYTQEGTTVFFPQKLFEKMVAIAVNQDVNPSSSSTSSLLNGMLVSQWISKCTNIPVEDLIATLGEDGTQE